MRKFIQIVALLLTGIMIFPMMVCAAPALTGFSEWEKGKQTTNNLQKPWNVKFSLPVSEDDIDGNTIYITDTDNKKIKSSIDISKDALVVTITPFNKYVVGQEYRLYITDNIYSKSNQRLSKAIVMPFIVNDESADYILNVESNHTSIATNIIVKTSADVYDVEINGKESHYEGDDTYSLGFAGLKKGDSIEIKAFGDNENLLQTVSYQIN